MFESLTYSELIECWEDIMNWDVYIYAKGDRAVDEKMFSSLIKETHRKLWNDMPEKTGEGLKNWENIVPLLNLMSAYSQYPTNDESSITLGFDASKAVVETLLGYYTKAKEHFKGVDFQNIGIPILGLTENYGAKFISFNLFENNFESIKKAILSARKRPLPF